MTKRKFTEQQEEEIRRLKEHGLTIAQIAKLKDVSWQTMRNSLDHNYSRAATQRYLTRHKNTPEFKKRRAETTKRYYKNLGPHVKYLYQWLDRAARREDKKRNVIERLKKMGFKTKE